MKMPLVQLISLLARWGRSQLHRCGSKDMLLHTNVAKAAVALAFLCSRASAEENTNRCKLYLAKSTIPSAGLGVFTGVDLSFNDTIG